MKRYAFILALFVIAVSCFGYPGSSAAQQEGTQPDGTIDASTRKQVIDTVLKRLNDSYVFPEVAQAMEKSIRERAAKASRPDLELTPVAETVPKTKAITKIAFAQRIAMSIPERQPRAGDPKQRSTVFDNLNSWEHVSKVERLHGTTVTVLSRFFGPELRPARQGLGMNSCRH